MTKMIALKPFTYATRALRAGQGFITKTDRDARILSAIGKATVQRDAGKIAPPPAALAKKIKAAVQTEPATEDMAALRAEYKAATGKNAFNGWDATELRARIKASAKTE